MRPSTTRWGRGTNGLTKIGSGTLTLSDFSTYLTERRLPMASCG
jgi:hypothetical protein